jgi:hypothetical protein
MSTMADPDDAPRPVLSDPRLAIVVRSDDPVRTAGRLQPVVDALAGAAAEAVVVVFDDDDPEALVGQVEGTDGVLVWADPLTGRGPRSALDSVLETIGGTGVWVSADPRVIDKIGTKDVLVTTRHLSWGSDTHPYPTIRDLRQEFPARLAASGTRVVKADRGNGGSGVWKVSLLHEGDRRGTAAGSAEVMVQHARQRDDTHVLTTLDEFMAGCAPVFAAWGGSGHLVDQPYAPRIAERLVRCYLVQGTVVGFALQDPPATSPVATEPGTPRPAVLGVPSPKTMVAPDHPDFSVLRRRLEDEWVPALRDGLDVSPEELPLLWDVDLIRGTPTESDPDPFVLCEINASSVIPFPPEAPAALATAVRQRLHPLVRGVGTRPPRSGARSAGRDVGP